MTLLAAVNRRNVVSMYQDDSNPWIHTGVYRSLLYLEIIHALHLFLTPVFRINRTPEGTFHLKITILSSSTHLLADGKLREDM